MPSPAFLPPSARLRSERWLDFQLRLLPLHFHRRHRDPKSVLVESIDKNTHSVVENGKQVGFQIPDIIPDFPNAVRVHAPAESEAIKEFAVRGELQLLSLLMQIISIPSRCWICCARHPMSVAEAGYCCTTSNWARLVAQVSRVFTMCGAEHRSELNGSLDIGHSAKSLAETLVRFKYRSKRPPLSPRLYD